MFSYENLFFNHNNIYISICEHDCPPFHIENANRIKANKHCRELMAMGRGMAKSMNYTTLVPLWLMLQGELKTMLVCSINSDKAIELLDPIRAELEGNPLLIHDFGKQKKDGEWEGKHFVTQNGCGFFALGIGQSPRGVRQHQSRVDYLVFDDCDDKAVCRNPKRLAQHTNWCLEDALGTTSPRGSRVVFVNNIFAEQTILTTIRDTRNDERAWHYTQVNATDENGKATWDYPGAQAYFDSLRAAMGPLSFASEYNNTPYAKGTVFTDAMIQWAEIPPLDKFEAIVGHWDVAYSDTATADFNAVQVWGLYQKNYYMIDCFTKQSQMREAIRWIFLKKIETENQARISFYYESQFWNKTLTDTIDEVQAQFPNAICRLHKTDSAKGNKFDRILEIHPLFQNKRIFFNRALQANSYCMVAINQLKGIEPGYKSHDDAPDAMAAAIEKLSKRSVQAKGKYFTIQKKNRKY